MKKVFKIDKFETILKSLADERGVINSFGKWDKYPIFTNYALSRKSFKDRSIIRKIKDWFIILLIPKK